MPIYQHETIEVIPGTMRAYLDGMIRMCVPEVCEPRGMKLTGFFQTDGTTGRWPEAVAIWQLDDWTAYAAKQRGGAHHGALNRWQAEAIKWRTGGFDRILVPLSFSPQPPVFPDKVRPGSLFVQETIMVRPGKLRDYIRVVADNILPRAARARVRLEACWRSIFRPLEVLALWSFPSWDHYAGQQKRTFARPDRASGITWPAEIWKFVSALEQKILVPAPFSPLGGGGPDYGITR